MSLLGIHILALNDAQHAIVKQALADAGHTVETAAISAGTKLVVALEGTSVGMFIKSEIETLKDSRLSGAEKFEQVVAKAIPEAITLFAAGGVTKTAFEVEDAVRATVQVVYNDTVSTTVPALAADAATIAAAVATPTPTAAA